MSSSSSCYLTRFLESRTTRQLGNTFAVFSILNPGKDPALPSSYRPISLLDTNYTLFERILLTRILCGVRGRGVMRNEQFGFRPQHSTALQITRFVERVSRNFDARRLNRRCFPRCGEGLRYCMDRLSPLKPTVLNFPSYLVNIMAPLVDSYRSGEKESSTETRSAGTSPKQEKWPLHQEWSSVVQAACPSYDGLHVPRLEVCHSLRYQETAGASVQVALHC